MPKRNAPEVPRGMNQHDPRRPLKLRRLSEERGRIPDFLSREPKLDDPEFEEWETAVHSLLVELFGANEFVLRFKQITFRPISYYMGSGARWHAQPGPAWKTAFAQADKVLREAIEEGAVVGAPDRAGDPPRDHRPVVNVTVHNQNVFSPRVEVSFEQILQQIEAADLSPAEKSEVKQHLGELSTEMRNSKRWPIMARSIESIKGVGKNVYKDYVVPLIVEFLKRESGLSQDSVAL